MDLTTKIRKALRIAAIQHDKQYRRDNKTPFIIHPIEVALVVSKYTDDENVICSALLHDVLEDTVGCTINNLIEEFDNKVANIVQSLTDEPLPDLTWDQKHQKYLKNLENSRDEAVLVCLADKFVNVSKEQLNMDRIWYYQGIINIAKDRELTKNTQLLQDFKNLIEKK